MCVACDFVFVSSPDHSIQDTVVAIGFSPFQFLGPLLLLYCSNLTWPFFRLYATTDVAKLWYGLPGGG